MADRQRWGHGSSVNSIVKKPPSLKRRKDEDGAR